MKPQKDLAWRRRQRTVIWTNPMRQPIKRRIGFKPKRLPIRKAPSLSALRREAHQIRWLESMVYTVPKILRAVIVVDPANNFPPASNPEPAVEPVQGA